MTLPDLILIEAHNNARAAKLARDEYERALERTCNAFDMATLSERPPVAERQDNVQHEDSQC